MDGQAALMQAAKDLQAIQRLSSFVRYMWGAVEPGREISWNWHLDIVCGALEKQIAGDPEYRKLLIMQPPGTMKSLLVSVFAPAWAWLREPESRGLFLANDDALVIRDSRRTREIITSDRYRRLIVRAAELLDSDEWTLSFDQNQKANFENTQKGFRQCKSIRSTITGKRGDAIVIDDPLDAKETVNGSTSQVSKRLEEVNNTIDVVLPSRVNDLRTARWTMIMQRLHVDDPAGKALKEGDWKVINIQMEFDPGNPLNHPDDPRTKPGELMFPERFPREALESLRRKLGARHYNTQYQQSPTDESGELFQRSWFGRRYLQPAHIIAQTMDEIAISVDCTFKKTDDSDYVVMQVWGRKGPDFYLLDQIRDRMTYPETRRSFIDMCRKWPQAHLKLIEERANGAALIDDMKRLIPGLVPYDPKVSKEARASVVAPFFEAGNVVLPDSENAAWIGDFVEEFVQFPRGSHDDQVDPATQILLKWSETSSDGIGELEQEFGFLL